MKIHEEIAKDGELIDIKIHEAIAKGGAYSSRMNNLGNAIMFKYEKLGHKYRIKGLETRERLIKENREKEAQIDIGLMPYELRDSELRGVDMAKFIANVICVSNGLTLRMIRTSTRKRHVNTVRQVCAYIAHKSSRASLTAVGEIINRDHSTIIHSIKTVKTLLKMRDPIMCRVLNRALDKLKNRELIQSKHFYLK